MKSLIVIGLLLCVAGSSVTVSAQDRLIEASNWDDEPSAEPSSGSSGDTALRIGSEFLVGFVVMGLSVGAGVLINPENEASTDLMWASLTGFVGGFPMAAAVSSVGDAMGGRGTLGGTILGTTIGGLLSAPIVFGAFATTLNDCDGLDPECYDDSDAYWGLLAFSLPILGAVLGYGLSQSNGNESEDPARHFSLSPTRGGDGMVGSVSGAF